MTNTMKKALSIIIAAAMIFTMSASFNFGKAYAETTKYTKDLGKVTITADKDLDDWIANPAGKDAEINIHVEAAAGVTLNGAELQWKNIKYNNLKGTSGDITIKTSEYGIINLIIYTSDGTVKQEIKIRPKDPTKVKFISQYNTIKFVTEAQSKLEYGDVIGVSIYDAKNNYLGSLQVENHKNAADANYVEPGTLKPGTKYIIKMRTYDKAGNDATVSGANLVEKTIVTGPATKPVIKSVKISNAKCTKISDLPYPKNGELYNQYKTSWTATITLSKKAKNIKGIVVDDGYNTYVVKGTKSKFTVKGMWVTKEGASKAAASHLGEKMNFTVYTYSDNTYKAYSPVSKAKVVKIK